MKQLLILLIIPLQGITQAGAKKEQTPSRLASISYSIFPTVHEATETTLPFKNIEVLDARFDTSKLGFELRRKVVDVNFKDYKKIYLEGGIRKSIQDFYNENYKSSFRDSDDNLLIVFKTLWIDNAPNKSYKSSHHLHYLKDSYQDIFVKAEFYLNRNGDYYPLKRIDTIYQLTEQNLQLYDQKLKIFNLAFFKASIMCLIDSEQFSPMISWAVKGRKLTRASIDSFNNSRFQLPILKQIRIEPGVFMNFNEFVNNKPSVKDYEMDKFGILNIKDASIDTKNCWGIADETGLHFWAHSILNNLRKPNGRGRSDITREGNTFEFFVNDMVQVPKTTSGNLIELLPLVDPYWIGDIRPSDGSKLKPVTIPRQINMETGEVY